MMGDRSIGEPAEYVMWSAAGLLAMILGVGTAFVFWAVLHRASGSTLVDSGVTCFSVGVAILGLSVERPLARAAFVIFAMALLATYLLGGPAFARLAF
jgi:hypothetical protein